MVEEIIGRESELEAINGFLDAVTAGPAALLFKGDAGIGKTTLWNEGLAAAEGRSYRLLVSRPVEAEARLSFVTLGDLLAEIPDEALSDLPDPQRRALAVALLREDVEGPPPRPRAVSLGFLEILKRLSGSDPVVLALDDLQWLDRSSATVLAFALRRLRQEHVGFLASLRVTAAPEPALDLMEMLRDRARWLTVGPLPVDHLDRIVRARLRKALPRPTLVGLERVSGGNPYYALEIAGALARQAASPDSRNALPVPRNLRELVRERLDRLPDAAREVILVVSALSQATEDVVREAVAGTVPPPSAVAQAVDARVIEVQGDRIRLAHPLLGSVVYSETSPARRRELHARLATVVHDPEERARHLALATTGRTETVAGALDEAAKRARGRGAPEAAAELLEQARRLTPADRTEDLRRRGLGAAEYHFEAGDRERARSLLEEVVSLSPPGPARAEALTRLGVGRGHGESFGAVRGVFEQALSEAGEESLLRAEIELALAWSHHHPADLGVAAKHAREALRIAESSGERGHLAAALATVGFLDALRGRGDPLPSMRRAAALEEEALWILVRPSWLLALVLLWRDDFQEARKVLGSLRHRLADQGDVQALPFVLMHTARLDCLEGNFTQAARVGEEAHDLASQSGQHRERAFVLSTLAMVEARRGNADATRALAEEAFALGDPNQPAWTTISTAAIELESTLGFLELSLGDVESAARRLGSLAQVVEEGGIGEPGVFRFHADAVEALIEAGEIERAEELLAKLEDAGRALRRTWALATAARCRGLLRAVTGDPGGALDALRGALEHHEDLPDPLEMGRTLLVRGVVQRRAKQRREARHSLQGALEFFDGLGASLWSAKARAELRRIGGRAPGRRALTPTEKRVAELASEGRTNREIAAVLHVTPKTVEANLTRIYRKLEVRSRTELARAMISRSVAAG